MIITVNPKEFAAAVATVATSVPGRPAIPILGAVVLEPTEKRLRLSSYDFEQSTRVECDATTEDPKRVAVSGRLLQTIAKVLPVRRDVEITLAPNGSRLVVASGATEFTLPTLEVEDYPELPTAPVAVGSVETSVLADAIVRAGHAAEREEGTMRTKTNCVQLVGLGDGTMTVTAVSHHRLATVDVPWTPEAADSDPIAFLVPAGQLTALARTWESQTSALRTNAAQSVFGVSETGHETTSSVLDDQFPNWERLLPKQYAATVVVDPAEIAEVLDRAAKVAEKAPFIDMNFEEDTAEIVVDDSIRDSFDITMHGDQSLAFRVNAGLLLESLRTVGGSRVTLAFDATRRMVVLHADEVEDGPAPSTGYRVVVMGGAQRPAAGAAV
ncbi:DNA polymerase III subunit beta [Gordonia sp. N1V]|uniref:DNA polymerase III subunit beta n=1 Tax=Gordonia sp. N1V TaxID=3034163 RepID=UPI0023E26635|nr:DNA polymerase III subunit beta [Gordonia sp. N1V]MDF3280868.1 DNA polymerase III subunit beta [Gordonia sp. N1V]